MGAEIVSVDSMQVYRGMDIGTAKPSPAQRDAVPHHMIDVAEPSEAYSVGRFQQEGRRVLDDLGEGRVLMVGGSGLHFRALVDPLDLPPRDSEVRAELEGLPDEEAVAALLAVDPEASQSVDLANPRRVVRALEVHRLTGLTPSQRAASPRARAVRSYQAERRFVAVGIDPGEALRRRVERRFEAMLDAGLLEEVAALEGRLGPTASEAVGYRHLLPVVRGEASLAQGRRRALDATTALARRQRTFFGRDPRLRWVEWDDDAEQRRAAVLTALEEAGWIS